MQHKPIKKFYYCYVKQNITYTLSLCTNADCSVTLVKTVMENKYIYSSTVLSYSLGTSVLYLTTFYVTLYFYCSTLWRQTYLLLHW